MFTPPEQRTKPGGHCNAVQSKGAISMPVRTPCDLEESVDIRASLAWAS